MTRRFPALVLLTLLAAGPLVGCASSPGAGPPASADSGIEGRTMVDGGCPVIRAGSPCPDRPLSARLTITGADSARTVARATSDADGRFRVPLPPGSYTIHPANLTGAVTPIAQPMTVTVAAGSFTTVTISFDSGIR